MSTKSVDFSAEAVYFMRVLAGFIRPVGKRRKGLIMNRLAEILKRHIWCVITIAAIILLALITLSFGKDVNLVSHLSLTGAVVSIVLAVIVIVYMYFQEQRSSQNITEMRRLIDEGYRTMTDKADLMVGRTQSLEQMMAGLTQPPADSDTTTSLLETQETLRFDVSVYGYWGLMVLYSLEKSHELDKLMSIKSISELLEGNTVWATSLRHYSFGIILSFRAFLGEDCIAFSLEQQKVKKLPGSFKGSITAQIDKRIKKSKDEGRDEDSTKFEKGRYLIDNYFDNL